MANISVYNMQGEAVGTMELNDEIFAAPVNEHLIKMAVVNHLAAKRQGTQKAKTRNEVSGGGRKPYRQKGTGNARQGSIRAAQWKGGGMIFAPTPRSYSFKLNKKEKQAAMKSALSAKVADGKLFVLDELTLPEIKTKKFVEVLNNLKLQKAYVVLNEDDRNVILSARNVEDVKTGNARALSVYDILRYDAFVTTKAAVGTIEEVYA